MPKREAQLCYSGYHAVRASSLLEWLRSDSATVYVAEGRGRSQNDGSKWCFEEMRLMGPVLHWNARIARLFACDCAERVLGIFETERPGDLRPRQAIDVVRRFARGEATGQERDAARDAPWAAAGAAADAAAWDVAWAAARAAARAAAWDAAWAAARAAAWDAAWAAARAAARAAAWDAERAWQARRLMWYLKTGGESDE